MNRRGMRGSPRQVDARAFCADAFPWPLIGQLADGDDVAAVYLVLESRRAETRANKPYLKLVLGDSTGTIDAMVWDDADTWEPLCVVEAVVGVRGKVGSFNDRLQLRVQSVESIAASAEDMTRLLPASRRRRDEMESELEALIASVEDRTLRRLLQRCLGGDTESGALFRTHPAAKRNHHAYLSGLLEHSLSVAGACDRLAMHYRATGIELDRDLLITGALLHDIGKLRELKGFPGVIYTTEGQLLGHIVIGIQMVSRIGESIEGLSEDRLLHLLHLIASHQGRPEWDSPKVPQMLEAMVLHYADDLDAKVNQAAALLEDVAEGEWSTYDRSFARSFLRPASAVQRGIGAGEEPARFPRASVGTAADANPGNDTEEPVSGLREETAATPLDAPADPADPKDETGSMLRQRRPRVADREQQPDEPLDTDESDGPEMDLFR